MSDISNLLIKDSYDYVIQVDPITKQVLRIGGSVPTNPIFLSGLTVETSFKYSDGSENVGYFLKCDAQGNATWAPVNVSGNTYALTGVSINEFTLYFTDSEGQVFPITITGGTLSSLVVEGNTIVNNISATTLNVETIILSGTNIENLYVKKGSLPQFKSGKVNKSLFSGQPYTYEVQFVSVLPDTDYTITVTGKDLRVWSIENESISGFTINTNSNAPLSNDTYWQLISIGEYNPNN